MFLFMKIIYSQSLNEIFLINNFFLFPIQMYAIWILPL
jgi:hypothetical protein